MVMAFISGANSIKYGRLIEELENSYLKGNENEYPKTVTDAYNLLLNYKNDPKTTRAATPVVVTEPYRSTC